MFKRLISLATTSVSFIALLLLANSNFAVPQATDYNNQKIIQPIVSQTSLNVVSKELALGNSRKNLLLDRSGCSCSVCVRAANNFNFEV